MPETVIDGIAVDPLTGRPAGCRLDPAGWR
jgi:hypothetical protein